MAWVATITIIFIPILFSRDPDFGPRDASFITYLIAVLLTAAVYRGRKTARAAAQAGSSAPLATKNIDPGIKRLGWTILGFFGLAFSLATLATYRRSDSGILDGLFTLLIYVGKRTIPAVSAVSSFTEYPSDRVQLLMACDTIFVLIILLAVSFYTFYIFRIPKEISKQRFKEIDETRRKSGQKAQNYVGILIFSSLVFFFFFLIFPQIEPGQHGVVCGSRSLAISECILLSQGDLRVIFGSALYAALLLPIFGVPACLRAILVT